VIKHDERSNEANTEAVLGAEHVHFHHFVSDMSATDRHGKRGKPCVVELVCHGCHKSALVTFRVDQSGPTLVTVRGDEVRKVREEFTQAHARCRAERGVDYTHICDVRRDGKPKVFDFAGVLG